MSKRIIAIAISVVLLSFSLSAADRITIQGGDMNFMLTVNPEYNSFTDYSLGSQLVLYPKNSLDWTPYLGGQEISREEFFTITGQDDLKSELLAQMKKEKDLHIAGLTTFGLGAVFTGVSFILYAAGNEFVTENIYPFAAAGIGTILLSLPLITYESKSGVDITTAIQIASDYNRRCQ